MKLTLKHPETKEIKHAPIGFSWTTFFFGFFPPFFRGDWKWGIIGVLALIISSEVYSAIVFDAATDDFFSILSTGESTGELNPFSKTIIIASLVQWFYFIVMAFKYNKIYIHELINKNYKVSNIEFGDIEQAEEKLGMNLPMDEEE